MLLRTLIILVLALSVNCYGVDLDSLIERALEHKRVVAPVEPVVEPPVVVLPKPVRTKTKVVKPIVVKPIVPPAVVKPVVVKPVAKAIAVVQEPIVTTTITTTTTTTTPEPVEETTTVTTTTPVPPPVTTTTPGWSGKVAGDEDTVEVMMDNWLQWRQWINQYHMNIDDMCAVLERQVETTGSNARQLGDKLRLILQYSYVEKYFYRQVQILNNQLTTFFPYFSNKIKIVYTP